MMDALKDKICRVLEEFEHKGELSHSDIDTVYKLVMTKEKLLRIDEIESEMGGYSNDGGWSARGYYGNYNAHSDGRMSNRSSYRGGYSRRYSMDDMDGGKRQVSDLIEDMLAMNHISQEDKMSLQRALSALRQ